MKTNKLIKRVFTLPCGEYTFEQIACAIGVKAARRGNMSARQRSRLGCRLAKLNHRVGAGKVLLFVARKDRRIIYRLEAAFAGARRGILHQIVEAKRRELSLVELGLRPLGERPPEPENPFARRLGETVAAYMERVRPLLAPEQLARPTRAGHERLCIAHGWDGFDRPPLSWPLYSAIACWNASEEGGAQ